MHHALAQDYINPVSKAELRIVARGISRNITSAYDVSLFWDSNGPNENVTVAKSEKSKEW
jgi:hypothetical protein